MCIQFGSKPKPFAAPPAMKPRQDLNTTLPVKKDVVDSDTKADVAYGTGAKKTSPAAGKKTGTDQLKIKLNTGAQGNETGGLNV